MVNIKLGIAFATLLIFGYYVRKLGKKGIMVFMIPYVTKIFLSSTFLEGKYKLSKFINYFKGKHKTLTYYHDVYDPHCIAMLHILPLIIKNYSIKIIPKLTTNGEIAKFGPKSDKFNIIDATIQAQYYEIPINLPLSYDHINKKNEISKQKLYDLCNSILAKYVNGNIKLFVENALKISNILWDSNILLNEKYDKILLQYKNNKLSETQTNKILKICNNELTVINRHYLSGNIYFNSEWFPRIDRILFLLQRLKPYKTGDISLELKLKNPFDIPLKLTGSNELNLYYSFRSPYSYLILERIYKIVSENKLKLNIKLVLPSIFRNVTINKNKSMYIPADCSRIAKLLNIKYGCIFDVGLDIKYIKYCFRLFLYARHKGKEKELTLELGKYTWAYGIDMTKVENVEKIFNHCGLNWNDYKNKYEGKYLNNDYMKEMENNLNDLYDAGNWGVPSIQYKNRCVWGQDRLWGLSDGYVKEFPDINID
eukprot:161808_1